MIPTVQEIKDDTNWQHAFHEAIRHTFGPCDPDDVGPVAGVVEVIAAVDGEHDEANWLGIFLMDDHRYAVLEAGCDYTGWD